MPKLQHKECPKGGIKTIKEKHEKGKNRTGTELGERTGNK